VTATIAVLGAWLLFGGTHLLLSWPPVRQWVTDGLGSTRFVVMYAAVAAVGLMLLAVIVARYGGDGPRGIDLAANPVAKWSLGAVAFFGAALATAGIASYPRSAIAILARRMRSSDEAKRQPLSAPTAIERVTRHPFFVGLALVMSAHALMAGTLPGAVFCAGFALLALIGIPMQDRKLRERHGHVYSLYEDATTAVPFATPRAMSGSGPQRTLPVIVTAIVGATIVALLHPVWRLDHGAWFAVLIAIGGLFAVVKQLWRSRNA